MSGKKSPLPTVEFPIATLMAPCCTLRSRWTEGVLPLWLVATAGGMAVLRSRALLLRLIHPALVLRDIDASVSHKKPAMGFYDESI